MTSIKSSKTKKEPAETTNAHQEDETKSSNLKVVVGILGVAATVVTALLALGGQVFATSRPIQATQTAEARSTMEQQKAVEHARNTAAVYTAEALVANSQATAGTILDEAGIWAAATQKWSESRSAALESTIAAINLVPVSTEAGETKEQAIEDFRLSIFPYSGMADPKFGFSRAILSVDRTNETGTCYRLEYQLSEEGTGWAGLAFKFRDPIDVSPYQLLKVILEYSGLDISGDLIVHDIDNRETRVAIGLNEIHTPDIAVSTSGMQQTIQIPINYFSNLNLRSIREITLNFDNARQKGNSTITVHWLAFLKP